VALGAGLGGFAFPAASETKTPWPDVERIAWPDGSVECQFENIEGIVLLNVIAFSSTALDTAGPFVLDTGAGYLGLDRELALWLGISDSVDAEPVGVTPRPLARLRVGTWEQDAVSPVLTFDADVVRRVTDRPVLGLLGQRLYRDRAVWLDYEAEQLVFIPSSAAPETADDIAASRAALAPVLSGRAMATRFRLLGDGKVVVGVTVTDGGSRGSSRALTMIVDTGSSKTVLFEHALAAIAPGYRKWNAISGLSVPTLLGDAGAKLTRVPLLRLEDASGLSGGTAGASHRDTDAALIDGELERVLATDIGEPVHGLLGYSFLRHFRFVLDYPRRVMWLDPRPSDREERPYEYTHVGLQLERRGRDIVVSGVVAGSPANQAGIRAGDVLVQLDGHAVAGGDLIEVARSLEGPAGTVARLVLRRGEAETSYRLARRRLL
jgi:hypothetical protein